MTQGTIDFDGDTYDRTRDHDRLSRQLVAVRTLMADGAWRTLAGLEAALGEPQASISARLRDLRKRKFGGYTVNRRYIGDGQWEYQVQVL